MNDNIKYLKTQATGL